MARSVEVSSSAPDQSPGSTPSSGEPSREQGVMTATRTGRTILSVLLAVAVLTLVTWNVPKPFGVHDDLRPISQPWVHVLGLDQNWELFSPNPSTTSIEVVADVSLVDGTTVRYEFPDGDPFVGALRQYHWRKYLRRLRLDDQWRLWAPAAEWVAAQFDRPTREVTLVRRFAPTPQVGSGDDAVWTEVEFFTWSAQGTP